ncbi:isochorismatase family protein [Brevibacterium sp. 5221]|uniref:Isochorismatase family protein n=1 Tax=Brevibacterium rongguiense TaxID=2695267 RepID=A0A6N9H6T7_9MICO|nr:isochorismatase family cysteine hydrolase [Brevibacterium rongguiense]MYM19778.1 isochorismatase family protein [Brevibacterium rongguiense]
MTPTHTDSSSRASTDASTRAAAPAAARAAEPTATALLLMDYQQGILAGFETATALTAAARAARAARAHGVPVVFVRAAFRPGFPELSASNAGFQALAAQAGDRLLIGNPGTELAAELERRDDEPLVTKKRIGAFAGSDLEVLLRASGARRLVLAGVATAGVVLTTVRMAADMDFELTVLADACADRSPEVHEVLMDSVFPRQADVATVAEWTAALAGAGNGLA